MAYGGDPENDTTDAVRLYIYDIDNTDLVFSDAEIDYFISTEATLFAAAARAAQAAAFKFAKKADKEVGDLKISYSNQAKEYRALAREYTQRAKSGAGAIFAGGISVADKKSRDEDTDRVKPSLRVNQFSNDRLSTNDSPIKSYEEDTL